MLLALVSLALVSSDPPNSFAYSDFASGVQGWTRPGGGDVEWIRDADGCLASTAGDAFACAPADFLGDFSALDRRAALTWTHRVLHRACVDAATSAATSEVLLSGPGGRARFVRSVPARAANHMRAPLLEPLWALEAGTWAALLADVRDVRIRVDHVDAPGAPWAAGEGGVMPAGLDDAAWITLAGRMQIPGQGERGFGQLPDCNGNGIPDRFEVIRPWILADQTLSISPDDRVTIDIFAGAQAGDAARLDNYDDTIIISGPQQGSFDVQGLSLEYDHSGGGACNQFDYITYQIVDECGLLSNIAVASYYVQCHPDDCNCNCEDDDDEGVGDQCDIMQGLTADCDGDLEADNGSGNDCDQDGLADCWEVLSGQEADANGNLIPDDCEDVDGAGTSYLVSRTQFGSSIVDSGGAVLSPDGRFAAFRSISNGIAGGDFNSSADVFLRDVLNEETVLVSENSDGDAAGGCSLRLAVSDHGRRVAYASTARVVPEDTNGIKDVYIFNREGLNPGPKLVSVADDGDLADGDSERPSLSQSGRWIVYESDATNLVAGDNNGVTDVFLFERTSDSNVTLISADMAGGPADGASGFGQISADGLHVAFESHASDLVPGDTNGVRDIFVRDIAQNTTVRVSVDSAGAQVFAESRHPDISFTGRWVVFRSVSDDLDAGDANGRTDVFVHDRDLDADGVFDEPGAIETRLVSLGSSGQALDADSIHAQISSDGRYASFVTGASNVVASAAEIQPSGTQLYRRDLLLERTILLSRDPLAQPLGHTLGFIGNLSADGSRAAFTRLGPNERDWVRDVEALNRGLILGAPYWVSIDANPCQNPNGPFTIEAWVLRQSASSSGTLVARWSEGPDPQDQQRAYTVEIEPDGAVRFRMAGGGNQGDQAQHEVVAGQLPVGSWHHVACVYDGAMRFIYIDGVLEGSRPTPFAPFPSNALISVGAHANGGVVSDHFQGSIDELRFWSQARTPAEIQATMGQRIPRAAAHVHVPNGLVSSYNFEGSVRDEVSYNDGRSVEGPARFEYTTLELTSN